jgi:hypothetical protein
MVLYRKGLARKRFNRLTRKRSRNANKRVQTRKIDAQPDPGPSQCHPAMGSSAAPQGCLPMEVLNDVAKKLQIQPTVDPAGLRKEIENRLSFNKPGAERSFLYALPLPEQVKTQLAKKYLRPPVPKEWSADPDMWLDTNNIADVMNQYEEARTKDGVKEFEFMGPFPIDFAAPDPYKKSGEEKTCLMNEMCEIRVKKALENGTRSIGIVYNLDPHFKSGSHWVANYIDLAGHRCYYFDSYGVKPPSQIETFMKWLAVQDPEMKLESNGRRLQYSNTECGMYCIYMIIRMLEGDTFLEITRRKPKDADMIDFRDWIYST